MHDDVESLHPPDAVLERIGALEGGADVRQLVYREHRLSGRLVVELFAVVVQRELFEPALELEDALGLGGVGDDGLLAVAHLHDALGQLHVVQPHLVNLVEYPDGVGRDVHRHRDEGGRVHREPEVQAVREFEVRMGLHDLQDVEALLAPVLVDESVRYPPIPVAYDTRLAGGGDVHLVVTCDIILSEPAVALVRRGHGERVVLLHVEEAPLGEMVLGPGVERHGAPLPQVRRLRELTADGHHDLVELPFVGDIGELLPPYPAQVAVTDFDTRDLERIVHTSEEDDLSGREIRQLERVDRAFPELGDAQRVNRPQEVGVARILDGPEDVPDDQGVRLRVAHHHVDVPKSGGGALAASLGALASHIERFRVPELAVLRGIQLRQPDGLLRAHSDSGSFSSSLP